MLKKIAIITGIIFGFAAPSYAHNSRARPAGTATASGMMQPTASTLPDAHAPCHVTDGNGWKAIATRVNGRSVWDYTVFYDALCQHPAHDILRDVVWSDAATIAASNRAEIETTTSYWSFSGITTYAGFSRDDAWYTDAEFNYRAIPSQRHGFKVTDSNHTLLSGDRDIYSLSVLALRSGSNNPNAVNYCIDVASYRADITHPVGFEYTVNNGFDVPYNGITARGGDYHISTYAFPRGLTSPHAFSAFSSVAPYIGLGQLPISTDCPMDGSFALAAATLTSSFAYHVDSKYRGNVPVNRPLNSSMVGSSEMLSVTYGELSANYLTNLRNAQYMQGTVAEHNQRIATFSLSPYGGGSLHTFVRGSLGDSFTMYLWHPEFFGGDDVLTRT